MTTLAEVNATLGVTNIALSSVAKEQKETNEGISKFVEFMKDKDTLDRREEIEEKRERKASVISRAGSAAAAAGAAVGGRALGLGKAGLGLGKDLFSKLGGIIPIGLAGAFLTSLVGSKLFRGGIAGLGFMFGDRIAEILTGPDAKKEVKDMLGGAIKGGALGFLLGPRFGAIGFVLGGLLSNDEIDEQAGRLLTNLNDLKVKFPALGKFFTGLTGAVSGGLESINNLLEGTSENKVKDIAKSIALVGGVATLLMPGKILGLLAAATRLMITTPAGIALLAIAGGGVAINKLIGGDATDATGFGVSALATGAAVYGAKRLTRGVPTAADDAARSQQARGRTLTGAPKDMRRTSTGAGSKFDRMMDVNLKGLSKYPRLLSFVKMVGRTGPLAALFGIGQIIQMASTGTLNAESLGKVFGGLIGGVGGTKLGAAIGSIFPGPGTLLGGLIGGGLGFFAGEYIAGKLANFLLGTDDGEFKKAGNPRAARAQAAAMKRGEELAKTYKSDATSGVRNQFEANRYGGGSDTIDPTGNPTGDVITTNSYNTNNYSTSNSGIVLDNSGSTDRKDFTLSSDIRNPSNLF
jgi:hypothetical protein